MFMKLERRKDNRKEKQKQNTSHVGGQSKRHQTTLELLFSQSRRVHTQGARASAHQPIENPSTRKRRRWVRIICVSRWVRQSSHCSVGDYSTSDWLGEGLAFSFHIHNNSLHLTQLTLEILSGGFFAKNVFTSFPFPLWFFFSAQILRDWDASETSR